MVSIAEVEQIVKRILGSASASILAQQNGTVLSDGHRVLNFQGAGVTVSDDPAGRRTNINIPGAPVATTTYVLNSTAGAGKASDLGVLGTPPSGWMNAGFSDAGWSAPVAETGPLVATALAGTTWITHTDGTLSVNDIWLFRQTFTPTAGTVSGASLQICADNEILGVWFNGTSLLGDTGNMAGAFATLTISPSLIAAGVANLLAVEVKNLTGSGGANPSSLDFKLTITYSGAGVDPTYELVAHKGATSGYAGLDSGGHVPTAQLGSGAASSSTFLRGDQTYAAASTNAVTIKEIDGTPTVTATTMRFPNGTLTDDGGGQVTYTPTAVVTSLTPVRTMYSTVITATPGTLAAIDATNLGYALSQITLAVGDIVEGILSGEFYTSSGSGTLFLDMQIDQPTSADVFSTSHANPAFRRDITGTRIGLQAHFWFVCTEAGLHRFRPVWKTSSPQINIDGGSTPTLFVVKNLGH